MLACEADDDIQHYRMNMRVLVGVEMARMQAGVQKACDLCPEFGFDVRDQSRMGHEACAEGEGA